MISSSPPPAFLSQPTTCQDKNSSQQQVHVRSPSWAITLKWCSCLVGLEFPRKPVWLAAVLWNAESFLPPFPLLFLKSSTSFAAERQQLDLTSSLWLQNYTQQQSVNSCKEGTENDRSLPGKFLGEDGPELPSRGKIILYTGENRSLCWSSDISKGSVCNQNDSSIRKMIKQQ